MCFFFQAEDGIRDGHVTGVQTCALPISPLTEDSAMIAPTERSMPPEMITKVRPTAMITRCALLISRSEERRVGKECRSRRWTDGQKKKVTKRIAKIESHEKMVT